MISFLLPYFLVPFLLALVMPNRKWLAAHAVLFACIVTYLYIDNERTPINARGAEWLGIFLRYVIGLGAVLGVVARSIALYLQLKGWRWVSATFVAVLLTALVFIILCTVIKVLRL